MNCGVVDHPEECLCDVKVAPGTAITKYVDPLRHGYYGKEIADYLGLAYPMTNTQILKALEMQVTIKDRLAAAERLMVPALSAAAQHNGGCVVSKKLTAEMQEQIGTWVLEGLPSREIRQKIVDTFGVNVSASHMSHLRKRLTKEYQNK